MSRRASPLSPLSPLSLASLLAVAIATAGTPAEAQTTPPAAAQAPPAHGVVEVGGAPVGPPASAAAGEAPVAPPAAGTVRIHFGTYRARGSANLYSRLPDGRYAFVCAAPCVTDAVVGTPMRVTYGGNDEEPHDMTAVDSRGNEVDVEVKGPSVGPTVGGIIMMGTGGLLVLVGAVFVAAAGDSRTADDAGLDILGYVCLGTGAGIGVGGLAWYLGRSKEPRIEAWPHGQPPEQDRRRRRDRDRDRRRDGRSDTFREDALVARGRDPMIPTLPATPLRLGFSF